jgi:hypothetical protein
VAKEEGVVQGTTSLCENDVMVLRDGCLRFFSAEGEVWICTLLEEDSDYAEMSSTNGELVRVSVFQLCRVLGENMPAVT